MEIQVLNTPINIPQKGVATRKSQIAQQINTQQHPAFGKDIKLKTIGKTMESFYNFLGEKTTPFNRFVIGAFAILTQPFIDLFNKDVDEETRKASCWRTVAKIVVGTTTGILARVGCIGLMKHFTMTEEERLKDKKGNLLEKPIEHKPHHDWLKPTDVKDFEKAKTLLKNHRNAIGTFVAIGVMMITDPPLTVFMTNFFNKKRQEAEAKDAAKREAALKGGN